MPPHSSSECGRVGTGNHHVGSIVVMGPLRGVPDGNLCGVHRTNEAHSVHTALIQSMWCTPRECDSKFHSCGECRTDAAQTQCMWRTPHECYSKFHMCGERRTDAAQMQSMWCTPHECYSKFHLCGEHRANAAHMQSTWCTPHECYSKSNLCGEHRTYSMLQFLKMFARGARHAICAVCTR